MRSVKERNNLLRADWQQKLKLNDYVIEKYNQAIQETPRLDGESSRRSKTERTFYINMTHFMTTLLDRKDRMSMGASLEVRVPFSDHRLVEYVWNIPWDIKMVHGREKGILRKAFEGVLPEEVLYRRKARIQKHIILNIHEPFKSR